MRQRGEPVPNQFPTCSPVGLALIAIVGECPGRDEDYQGQPFVGESGRILSSALEHIGLTRSQMLVGNVCQAFPGEGRDFNSFAWEGEAVQAGVAQLRRDLQAFAPTMVLCLGNAALHLFKHGNVAPPKRGGKFDWPSKVGDWRGSLFWSDWANVKALAAYHPAAVAREQGLQAYYRCAPGVGDLERLKSEAGRRELVLPKRTCVTPQDILTCLASYKTKTVAVDIEGYPGNITSIAFADAANRALVIPLAHIDGTSVWSEADEVSIWQAVKDLLEDDALTIIGQNFSYDAFALAWTYGIVPRGRVWDTMELWWECFPELDKGLDVQASLLTLQPFYKPDKHREDGHTKLVFGSDEEFWRYNGLDACVTFECWQREMEMLTARARQQMATQSFPREGMKARPTCLSHAEFNSSLFAPAKLYPMLRGIKVDLDRVEEEKAKAALGAWELQAEIDRETACMQVESKLWEFYDAFTVKTFNVEPSEEWFAQLCLAQLGGKNPRRRVEVVEERWQPMKWGGKKWVKDGKLTDLCQGSTVTLGTHTISAEPPANTGFWLKPMPRAVSRLQPFTPANLDEVEPHLLKEGQAVWKRVKKLWRELKHERTNRTDDEATSMFEDCSEAERSDCSEVDGRQPKASQSGRPQTAQEKELKESKHETKATGRKFSESLGEAVSTMDSGRLPRAGLSIASPTFAANEKEKSLTHEDTKTYAQAQAPAVHAAVVDNLQAEGAEVAEEAGVDNLRVATSARLGELSTLLGLAVNIGSTGEGGDAQWFLFEVCGLPKVWKDERSGRYSRESESEWKRRRAEAAKGLSHESKRHRTGQADERAGEDRAVHLTAGDRRAGEQEGDGAVLLAPDVRSGKHEWKRRTKEGVKHENKLRTGTRNGANDTSAGPDDTSAGQAGSVAEGSRATTASEQAPAARPGKRLSTDQQALDKLYAATQDVRVLWCLQQRRLRMVISDLSKEFDADGRVRSSISLVKDTGRMAASKSPLGTGTNLMALNKDLLRICVADEGCELGKFDLEGADSWTVAAECAALGDETMLLDLKAGLKPAKVLCALYAFGEEVNMWYRDRIKVRLKYDEQDFQPWLYPAEKSTIYGYCYGSGWETTRDTILKYSMADLPLELGEARPIVLSKAQVEKLRVAAASRYPGVKLWHAAEGKAMLAKGWIDMSTGHRRLFFGRKAEWKQGQKQPCHDTLKEWLASKPQYYTTLTIKLALLKLWEDETNRRADGTLRVEPLMARHDELLVQWRVEDREGALIAMKRWLYNELEIAGQKIVIPAEGKVGSDWGMK